MVAARTFHNMLIPNVETNCFVLLERLDKRILARYLQKTPVWSKGIREQHDRARSAKKYSETQRKWDSHKSALRSDHKRKRRKTRVKCFCYTDDEDDDSRTNLKEKFLEKTEGDEKCSTSSSSSSCAGPPEGFLNSKNFGLKTIHESDITGSKQNLKPTTTPKTEERSELIKVEVQNIDEGSFCKTPADEPLKPYPKTAILQNDRQIFANKMDMKNSKDNKYNAYERAVQSEVECRKYVKLERIVNCVGEEIDTKTDEERCAPVQKREFLEDEDGDLPDDDEDDRATVIFEESFKDAFDEIFEIEEEKIRNVNKKFKKKKITNRKKRTLVKFKRKRSMIGRYFAKVKKYRNICLEVSNSEQQFAEKTSEAVSERCMREVCALVKRLQEMYKILLQLQKDVTKNPEDAEHFKRIINVHQENFCKEIKRSQKTIIRGYEKMVNCYGNTNAVSTEIGRRTFLSKEDVARMISRCAHTGAVCEESKKEGETEEQELNSREMSSKHSAVTPAYSENLKKHIDDKIEAILLTESVQEVSQAQSVQLEKSAKVAGRSSPLDQQTSNSNVDAVSMPPPQPVVSPRNRPPVKSRERPNIEFKTAGENTAEEIYVTTPSNHFLGGSSSRRDSCQGQWGAPSKPRPHFYPQKNYSHRTDGLVRDPRMRQLPQDLTRFNPQYTHVNHVRPFPPRPVHLQSPNIRAQYRGGGFPAQSVGNEIAANYPVNNDTIGLFHVPADFVPSAPGRSTRGPVPPLMNFNPYPSGYNREGLPANHFSHISNSYSSSSTDVRAVPSEHDFARSRYNNNTSQRRSQKYSNYSPKSSFNSRRRNVFPSSKTFECSVNGAPRQVFPREGQRSLKSMSANFAGSLQPGTSNYTTQTPTVSEMPINPEETCSLPSNPTSESKKPPGCALDPTVPQKLTMRNCRLEAGPILETKNESSESGGSERPTRWHQPCAKEVIFKDDDGSEYSKEKDSNSRVYVCAQNGCKNPGIRICKGCLSIIYCGETCQLKHWTVKHKSECHQLKELRG